MVECTEHVALNQLPLMAWALGVGVGVGIIAIAILILITLGVDLLKFLMTWLTKASFE